MAMYYHILLLDSSNRIEVRSYVYLLVLSAAFLSFKVWLWQLLRGTIHCAFLVLTVSLLLYVALVLEATICVPWVGARGLQGIQIDAEEQAHSEEVAAVSAQGQSAGDA